MNDFENLRQTIAIHENSKSEKVVKFVHCVDELLPYCCKRTAIKIMRAAVNGKVWGVYKTKTGIRTKYI